MSRQNLLERWFTSVTHASIFAVTYGELALGIAALLGAVLGSFLNVVIHRVPLAESILYPRSRCPSCDHSLSWWENLPVVSWLLLRGRCHGCGQGISVRYPIVEILCALLAYSLFARFGPTPLFLVYLYFALNLVALTYIDLDHQLLPDRMTLSGLIIGLAVAPMLELDHPLEAAGEALLGAFIGGGILYAVAWGYEKATGREGMGGGDIKLLAMIGAFLGWQGVLLALFLASVIGSFVGVIMMLTSGADRKLALPFGPFLALGALVSLYWGDGIVAWYLGRIGS